MTELGVDTSFPQVGKDCLKFFRLGQVRLTARTRTVRHESLDTNSTRVVQFRSPRNKAGDVVAACAVSTKSGVDLEVDGGVIALGECLEMRDGRCADSDSRFGGCTEVLVGCVQPGEDGSRDSGGAKFRGLGDVGDAQPVSSAGQSRAGRSHRTVPISVCLDDDKSVRGGSEFAK